MGLNSTSKRISFEAWIDRTGTDVIAKRLKLSVRTIQLWRKGLNDPRVGHMRRLKRLFPGEIDYDQIIDRGSLLTNRKITLKARLARGL